MQSEETTARRPPKLSISLQPPAASESQQQVQSEETTARRPPPTQPISLQPPSAAEPRYFTFSPPIDYSSPPPTVMHCVPQWYVPQFDDGAQLQWMGQQPFITPYHCSQQQPYDPNYNGSGVFNDGTFGAPASDDYRQQRTLTWVGQHQPTMPWMGQPTVMGPDHCPQQQPYGPNYNASGVFHEGMFCAPAPWMGQQQPMLPWMGQQPFMDAEHCPLQQPYDANYTAGGVFHEGMFCAPAPNDFRQLPLWQTKPPSPIPRIMTPPWPRTFYSPDAAAVTDQLQNMSVAAVPEGDDVYPVPNSGGFHNIRPPVRRGGRTLGPVRTALRGSSPQYQYDNWCNYCYTKSRPLDECISHRLRTVGKLTCPLLRQVKCPICEYPGGDDAHERNYCPRNKQATYGRSYSSTSVVPSTNAAPGGFVSHQYRRQTPSDGVRVVTKRREGNSDRQQTDKKVDVSKKSVAPTEKTPQ